MASQTFLNLPKEKQNMLIMAAIKEFSRVSFEDASINKIIKEVGVPRGSFYMYFVDKRDLYNYIVDQYIEQIFVDRIKLLKKHKGDLFNTYIDLFELLSKQIQKKERRDFFRNIFLNINYENEGRFLGNCDETKNRVEQYIKLIDKNKLNYKNEDDLKFINNMYMITMMHSIAETVINPEQIEDIRKAYYVRLSLLKNGTYKERGD